MNYRDHVMRAKAEREHQERREREEQRRAEVTADELARRQVQDATKPRGFAVVWSKTWPELIRAAITWQGAAIFAAIAAAIVVAVTGLGQWAHAIFGK